MAVKERTTIALDPEVKREATDVLEQMGLSLSSFTEICLRQVVRDKGMPFTPSLRPIRPDGYPVPPAHDAYRFERSKSTGNIVLPQEWDDPADFPIIPAWARSDPSSSLGSRMIGSRASSSR